MPRCFTFFLSLEHLNCLSIAVVVLCTRTSTRCCYGCCTVKSCHMQREIKIVQQQKWMCQCRHDWLSMLNMSTLQFCCTLGKLFEQYFCSEALRQHCGRRLPPLPQSVRDSNLTTRTSHHKNTFSSAVGLINKTRTPCWHCPSLFVYTTHTCCKFFNYYFPILNFFLFYFIYIL